MFKSITNKIKEKLLKLGKRKNTNSDMELSFNNTNLVDIQEEEITEEIIKELDECLNFINDVTVNMKEFYPEILENKGEVKTLVLQEEELFHKTLSSGEKRLVELMTTWSNKFRRLNEKLADLQN